MGKESGCLLGYWLQGTILQPWEEHWFLHPTGGLWATWRVYQHEELNKNQQGANSKTINITCILYIIVLGCVPNIVIVSY